MPLKSASRLDLKAIAPSQNTSPVKAVFSVLPLFCRFYGASESFYIVPYYSFANNGTDLIFYKDRPSLFENPELVLYESWLQGRREAASVTWYCT
jgi:hypothetical protein